jgi:voltage-dependent calcium channel T type alpha-1H
MDYGGDWIRMDSNFDNIWNAMSTMFKISMTEGWLDIMWHQIDSVGEGKMPIRDNRPIRCLFPISFILLMTWFILNVFDGITVDNYIKEKEIEMGLSNFTKR